MTPTQPVCRAVRLVYIMQLLDSAPYTVDDLAERCGVTRRVIFSDLAVLQDDPIRYPVVSDLWCGMTFLAKLDRNSAP